MFDAYGPTRLVVAGNIVLSVSLMMTSIATKYYQFILAQGILFGVGFGLLFYPSVSATATHFTKYRGTALGIVMSGSSIGGVVFPIMLQRLFNQVGFGWAVRISAFICFGCGTFSCFAVSSRLPKRTPSPWIDRASLKEVNFILFVAAGTICCLGVFVPLIYIVPYGQANSISQALSYDLLSVINAGGTFGRILPAFLADIGGRFNCLIPCTLIAGIFCSAWWSQAHDLPSIMIYAAMYGFFIGPWFSLQISCLAQFSKMENIGARVGMLYSGAAFFALVGAPIAGALLTTQKGNYTGLIEWAGASLICSSLIYLVVKLRLNKSVLAKV
ncbi:major facilitator superfamily domain-containing protein [Hygrophoropsis aurantiaca]|uniref:Major facilitator superfamily domain-containing protein n=1 Tax=Hygrophoropsis aurantiaca TaxID=72124 RepID=A0ACB7ZQJ7_9AGAM|nr:major facilitator superfamily domain-containing protein [Hygrophoropsis aurantiaca]